MQKLVFLHIEKSAGTSMRTLFDLKLGRGNVFWFGRDSNSELFDCNEVEDFRLIGGHRVYSFYATAEYGYMGLLREPLERVVSFYQYLRTTELENWRNRGLDPHSLDQTIRNSDVFLESIRGGQCRYLSGIPEFDGTVEHIYNNKYLVGSLEQIGVFYEYLGNKMCWQYSGLLHKNISPRGYRQKVHLGWRTKRVLRDLLKEDDQLYRYLVEDLDGLINTITNEDWQEYYKLLEKPYHETNLLLMIETLDLADDTLSAGVILKNCSALPFPVHPEYFVSMRALGAGGVTLRESRSRIGRRVIDGGTDHHILVIENSPRNQIEAVQFGIFDEKNGRWLGIHEVSSPEIIGI